LSIDASVVRANGESRKAKDVSSAGWEDLNNRLNVIDFAGLFSENAMRSRAPHETVALLTVKESTDPVVPGDSRFKVEVLGEGLLL
jgi:hypothetical protein